MKNCPNCLQDFEPNSGKQKFCSDKCKVSFARKTAKGIEGVKTANEVPQPQNKEISESDLIDIEVGKQLIEFCKLNKTNTDDLFSWLMDNYGKKPKTPSIVIKQGKESTFHDFAMDKCYKKPYNPFDNPIYNAKMAHKK